MKMNQKVVCMLAGSILTSSTLPLSALAQQDQTSLPLSVVTPARQGITKTFTVTGVKPGRWDIYAVVEQEGQSPPTKATDTGQQTASKPPGGGEQPPGGDKSKQPGKDGQPPQNGTGTANNGQGITPEQLKQAVESVTQQLQQQQQQLVQQMMQQQQQAVAQLQQQMQQQSQQLQQSTQQAAAQAAQAAGQQVQQAAAQTQQQLAAMQQQQEAIARQALATIQQRIDNMGRNLYNAMGASGVGQDSSRAIVDALNRMMMAQAMMQAQKSRKSSDDNKNQGVTAEQMAAMMQTLEERLSKNLTPQQQQRVVEQLNTEMQNMQNLPPPQPLPPISIKATDYERVADNAEQVSQGDVRKVRHVYQVALAGAAKVTLDEFSTPQEVQHAKEFALHLADRFRQLKDRVGSSPDEDKFKEGVDKDIKDCLNVYSGAPSASASL